jgi:predicted Zn-dependent protease
MVQKILFSILLLTMMTTGLWGQKKELSQARTYIKSGKDYDKAEKLMKDLVKNPENRTNAKIYATWYDAVAGQYAQANEKLYLKQAYDTAAFFNITQRMYRVAETLDSLDMKPDEKGRVKLEYRKEHAEQLNLLRPNLYYGGTYQVRREDYRKAFDYFDLYIGAAHQPLFTGYNYLESDKQVSQAAYWATLCGFRLKDPKMTLKYSQLALTDYDKSKFVMHYMCEAYQQLKNKDEYLKTLNLGFKLFPTYPYFFPRLADHYNSVGHHEKVLQLAEQGLKRSPNNSLFLLAKSIALLNMNKHSECIDVSRQMIALNKEQPEPYYNIATCYLNEALSLEQLNDPRKYRAQLTKLYTDACPMMEKYRELMPDDIGRWGPALYRTYLNLNKGKQFDEIDRLMRGQK